MNTLQNSAVNENEGFVLSEVHTVSKNSLPLKGTGGPCLIRTWII